MRPSEALEKHRDEVLAIIARYPVTNPRVFGSVACGEDTEESDLDVLVHPETSMSYFELARLNQELEELLGCKVDLGEDDSLRRHAESKILATARAL